MRSSANRSLKTLAVETARTLPRLTRLGQINDHTRISLGRIIGEQAAASPNGEFLLFDGRVHHHEAVNRRIDNVVRGLIDVGVRQGARIGVLMKPGPAHWLRSPRVVTAGRGGRADAAGLGPPRAVRLGRGDSNTDRPGSSRGSKHPVQAGPGSRRRRARDLDLPEHGDVIDMEDRSGCGELAGVVPAEPGPGARPRIRGVQFRWRRIDSNRSPTIGGRCRPSGRRRPRR